jgi:hypothetical protein
LRAWARQGNPEKEKLKLLQLLLSLAMTKRWLDSGLRRVMTELLLLSSG